jgi:hypothetical protein
VRELPGRPNCRELILPDDKTSRVEISFKKE